MVVDVEIAVVSTQLDTIMKKVNNKNEEKTSNCVNILNISVILIVVFTGALPGYSFLFFSDPPKYRCLVPECDNTTTSNKLQYEPDWLHFAVPYKEGAPENCYHYEYIDEETMSCSKNSFNANNILRCNQFVFETDFIGIAREFQLLCHEKLWMLTLPATIQIIGTTVASPLSGYLSDRFGRKITLILLAFSSGLISILQSKLSYNFWILIAFELVRGILEIGVTPAAFTLVLELLTPAYRTFGAFAVFFAEASGEAALALVVMYTTNWRTMLQISSAASLFVIIYGWFIKESPRWKYMKFIKKWTTEQEKPSTPIQKFVKITDTDIKHKKEPSKSLNSEHSETFLELLKSPQMALRLSICIICWCICGLIYYGMNLESIRIVGNQYLNFSMVLLVEIPGSLIPVLFGRRFGCKRIMCTCFFTTGICCLVFLFINEGYWFKTVIYLLGKCTITAVFDCLYIYTAELFPTTFRQSIIGLCLAFNHFGSILAPQMPFLTTIWSQLPHTVFSITALFSAVLCFSLPNTMNKKLPDTIEECLSNKDDTNSTDTRS